MEIHTGSTGASIEHLKWDPVTVLSIPRQFNDGLYSFDDLPLDHRCERDTRV